jgi:sporulation integral membrane protein YlbJ
LAAVAVGMLHNPSLGLSLIVAHYGANLTLGLLIGILRRKSGQKHFFSKKSWKAESLIIPDLWTRALSELRKAHRENWQPLGQRFTAAISKSVNTLLIIGGFIIIFSVIIEALGKLGVLGQLSRLIAVSLSICGIEPALSKALATGLFEITLGTKLAAETAAPLTDKIMIITMLLSWSGLSVHAQVAGLISGTDLRFLPFFLCRIAQAFLAAGYSFALYRPLTALAENSVILDWPNQPAFAPLYSAESNLFNWWQHLTYFSSLFTQEVLLLLVLACLLPVFLRIKTVIQNRCKLR